MIAERPLLGNRGFCFMSASARRSLSKRLWLAVGWQFKLLPSEEPQQSTAKRDTTTRCNVEGNVATLQLTTQPGASVVCKRIALPKMSELPTDFCTGRRHCCPPAN